MIKLLSLVVPDLKNLLQVLVGTYLDVLYSHCIKESRINLVRISTGIRQCLKSLKQDGGKLAC